MGKVLTAIGVMACVFNAHATAYDLGCIAGRVSQCCGVLTEDDLDEDVLPGFAKPYSDTYVFVALESGEASFSSWSTTVPVGVSPAFLNVFSDNDETFLYNVATRTFHVQARHRYTIEIKTFQAQGQTYSFTLDLPGSFTSAVVPGSITWATGATGDVGGAFTGESARIYKGRMTAGSLLGGVLEVKTGKAKDGKCKVSAVVTSVTGKKFYSSAPTVFLTGGGPLSADLKVKGLGTLSLSVGANGFFGRLGEYIVASASIGGALAASTSHFRLDCDLQWIGQNQINREFLPLDEPVMDSNGKWWCRKAAVIGYSRGAWVVQNDSAEMNLSGLKLNYTPKTGVFRGTFKVYTLSYRGKPKKYSFKVNGLVVDGVGYAYVSRSGSSDSWSAKIQ